MSGSPPSGTVTFMLTDLEGSTRLWEQAPEAMKAAMHRHDEVLEKAIAANQGFVFSRMGDGMAAAFATASGAVSAAAAIQQALADESWGTAGPLRARIGLHTDEGVVVNDNNYASQPVNRCSRLMAAAHGGQVVLSGATEALVRDDLPKDIRLIDLGEHRLRDLGRPTRVFQLTRAGQPEEFPPLRSLDAFPGNLPAQVSSFIGRRDDVSRVTAALGNSRVVTITGVGGVGKTRLAVQVAAELLPRYREGAWLVELASVRDPEGVVDVVAEAFHLTPRSGESLEDSLIKQLSHKQLLLVLDNCEHVLAAVARLVARIERKCPDVAVLATSREGIAIDGEQVIALPPLEAGRPGEDIDRLVHTDAVSLFVERARQGKADFELTRSNAGAVIEVCQRLDGVPLAIELAAARVIALSPSELAKRLDRRFQVLAGGRRGAVERHATLRAAIDWSYELLSAAEQQLLARMAVFSGGCTLEAIEEVCSGDAVDRDAVVDLVTALVARSLVVAEDTRLGTRYRMLETIRQYAEERLADAGETGALLLAHGAFYAALCADANENFYGTDQLVWARQVNVERDNIRLALTNAIDSGHAALAVQLVANQPHQERAEGPTGEVVTVPILQVLDVPGAEREPGYSFVLLMAAYTAQHTGDWDSVDEFCRRATEAEEKLPSSQRHPRIEMDIGSLRAQALLAGGHYADALSAYIRSAELASAAGYLGLGAINLAYGVSCAVLGGVDADGAVRIAEDAVALARRSGMPSAIVLALNALAFALVERDPPRARALLKESVELGSTPGEEVSSGLLTASMVAGRLRDWELTVALSIQTMHLWRWSAALMQTAPCLALCARAVAGDRPEIAGILRGAAYAAFSAAGPGAQTPSDTPIDSQVNFVLDALRETREIVTAALGNERQRELRAAGAAMTMDEAVSYALANVEPRPSTPAPKRTFGR